MTEETRAQMIEAAGWALCADAGGGGKGRCDLDECCCGKEAAVAVDAALKALAAQQDGAWQPIETAPRAETMILGYQATPGDHERQMGVCWSIRAGETFIWIGAGGLMPTHWRPLPAPPAS